MKRRQSQQSCPFRGAKHGRDAAVGAMGGWRTGKEASPSSAHEVLSPAMGVHRRPYRAPRLYLQDAQCAWPVDMVLHGRRTGA